MPMKNLKNLFAEGKWVEVIRFAQVGVVATAVQYGVYLLLSIWLQPLLANTIAYVVSFIFNYMASVRYTFRVRSSASRGAGFAFAHVINYLLQTFLLSLFLRLGISKALAILPVLAVSVPSNFLMVRYFMKNDLSFLHSVFALFRLKREERLPSLSAGVFFVGITAVFIAVYYPSFSIYNTTGWEPFYKYYRMSGYDSFIYSMVSHWRTFYTIDFRHPLLSYFCLPLYGINYGLFMLTGLNMVQFVVAAVLLFCAFYAFVFLFRTYREVLRMSLVDSTLLAAMTFSFAHVMVAVVVPDHFILSLFLLSLTLYLSGSLMTGVRGNGILSTRHTALLLIITAGVTLTNGIKTALASFFVNRRAFFKPSHLLAGIVLPFVLLSGVSRLTYTYLTRPDEIAREKQRVERQARLKTPPPPPRKRVSEPISEEGFLKWSDITTSRPKSVYHNLFGESIQFHRKDLLRDSQYGRELFAAYDAFYNYLVEGLVVALFIIGIWCGRHSRLLWMCLSWFAFDMVMHLGFGFALREIYLMSAHWLFVVPLAIAFILRRGGCAGKAVWMLTMALTLYLYIYNAGLLIGYLLD